MTAASSYQKIRITWQMATGYQHGRLRMGDPSFKILIENSGIRSISNRSPISPAVPKKSLRSSSLVTISCFSYHGIKRDKMHPHILSAMYSLPRQLVSAKLAKAKTEA
jgi:hypothetical protein